MLHETVSIVKGVVSVVFTVGRYWVLSGALLSASVWVGHFCGLRFLQDRLPSTSGAGAPATVSVETLVGVQREHRRLQQQHRGLSARVGQLHREVSGKVNRLSDQVAREGDRDCDAVAA